ncbi:MAG: hypothetical protein ABEJ87_03925, partial [Candidatus Nanohalobium sp.]
MNWDNQVHGPTYPVGNTHLPYFEDVTDYFEEEGLEPEDSHIVTVGSDLIGWWMKDEYPEAEVTTVEVNPRTSYLQNFAGDYLSRPDAGKSTDELKELIGIDDPTTGIPNFVEEDVTPLEVLDEHTEYVRRPGTVFDQVPDFSQVGFAFRDFYPGIIDEIGFNTQRPDNHVIGDFRQVDIDDADAVFTNNVVDTMGRDELYTGLDDVTGDQSYVEVVSEPGSHDADDLKGGFPDLEAEINPDVDFWWKPSPLEQKEEDGYRPTVVLY